MKTGYYITFACVTCGKEVTTWTNPSTAKVRKYKFCSCKCIAKCKHKDFKRKVYKCLICGKGFENFTHKSNRKYCSKECTYIGRIRLRDYVCDFCKKPFKKRHKGIGRNKYCSNECKWKGRGEGVILAWGRNWVEQRDAVRILDKFTCQSCGKKTKTVHHIIPRRKFLGHMEDANTFDNLILLCQSCHIKVETGNMPCPPTSR